MRHLPIASELFVQNRQRLRHLLLPNSLVVVHANDLCPTTTDGLLPMFPNSDLFYLAGIEQEESILILAPDAADPAMREILLLREPNAHLKIWEGDKLTKEQATQISGITSIRWLSQFPGILHQLMCQCDHVYLNSNEHPRAHVEVQTRDARFIHELQQKYPLHRYERLAKLMRELRGVKLPQEVELIRQAIDITDAGLRQAYSSIKPGVWEYEVEAQLAQAFIARRGRFAFSPIIASGAGSCVLHYVENNRRCKAGDVLLIDVGAAYANYNADLTRTVPVSGRFTRRQKQVYNAVLRVMRQSIAGATPGKVHKQWQQEAQAMMTEELLELKLLTKADVKKQTPESPACRKYFMHGLGHSLGLGVHDLGDMGTPLKPGMVLTVEPGIYIPEENLGIRLENDILVTEGQAIDLSAKVPVEPAEIEQLLAR